MLQLPLLSVSVPSPPTHVGAKTVNSTAIKVTWQLPLQPNGEISFRLYYWQSSEGWGTRKRAYDGPGFESTVAGLHEYVAYTFFVQAYNVKYSWNSIAVNVSETTHPAGKITVKIINSFQRSYPKEKHGE